MAEHPEELERRLAILSEPAGQGEDIDGMGWGVLVLLGVIVPVLLLLLGWQA